MLRKILLAGAALCAFGAFAAITYDDAVAQQRRGGLGRTGGGARSTVARPRTPAMRSQSRMRTSIRPGHRRPASPGSAHSRRLSPGTGHSRRLSPGGHSRRLSPGGHSRRLSPGTVHRRAGSPSHRRVGSFGPSHRRFGSYRPTHWRLGSRGIHRRAWSWHARTSSWVRAVPAAPAGVAVPAAGAPGAGPCPCTCLMTIYKGENFTGENREARTEEPDLGPAWDNQIASIYVSRGTWEVYQELNYQGEVMRLPPGPYGNLGPQWTRSISSLRCVP